MNQVQLSQIQLNRLWASSSGFEIEALRVRPHVDSNGIAVAIVYQSGILQTMSVKRYLPNSKDGEFLDLYVRRRDCNASNWGEWRSCSGEECK